MFEGSYKNLLHHRLFITKALILESPHPLQWIEDKVEVLRLFLLSYLPAMEALLHLTDTGMCGKFWSGAHLQRKSRRRFDGRAATPGLGTWVERRVLHEHRKWVQQVFVERDNGGWL